MFWDRTATGKKITPWNTASGNSVTDGRDGSQTSKGSSTRLRLRRAGSGRCSARCGAGQSSRCGRRLCAMGPGRRGQRSPAAPLVPWKSGHAPPRGRRGRRSDGKGEAPLTPGPAPAPAHPGVSHVSPPLGDHGPGLHADPCHAGKRSPSLPFAAEDSFFRPSSRAAILMPDGTLARSRC